MSWLARLEVDTETVFREGLAKDIYSWHRLLWDCAPNDPDAKRDFLTRIDQLDGSYRLWIMSERKPVCPKWCLAENFAVKDIPQSFFNHKFYAFDLKVNPVKRLLLGRDDDGKVALNENGKRKRGKRIPIVRHDELRAWLFRKAEARSVDETTKGIFPGGFRVVETLERPLDISPVVENHFRKKDHSAYHAGVQFRGILEVTDRDSFIKTYHSGIGSAKGFGFGLLLLAPVNF